MSCLGRGQNYSGVAFSINSRSPPLGSEGEKQSRLFLRWRKGHVCNTAWWFDGVLFKCKISKTTSPNHDETYCRIPIYTVAVQWFTNFFYRSRKTEIFPISKIKQQVRNPAFDCNSGSISDCSLWGYRGASLESST